MTNFLICNVLVSSYHHFARVCERWSANDEFHPSPNMEYIQIWICIFLWIQLSIMYTYLQQLIVFPLIMNSSPESFFMHKYFIGSTSVVNVIAYRSWFCFVLVISSWFLLVKIVGLTIVRWKDVTDFEYHGWTIKFYGGWDFIKRQIYTFLYE